MTKDLAIPLCLINLMTARFISRTSSKTTQKQRYPTIEMAPASSGGNCFANRKCAKGLPLSSASNILRVQGVEKQASLMCKMSGRDSTVASSMTHPPITPALSNTTAQYAPSMCCSCLFLAPPEPVPRVSVPLPHVHSLFLPLVPDVEPPATGRRILRTSILQPCVPHRADHYQFLHTHPVGTARSLPIQSRRLRVSWQSPVLQRMWRKK